MSIKLRNRKAAEAQLGQFVEDISLPPKLISAIVDGEVRTRAVPRRAPRHLADAAMLAPAACAQPNEAYVHSLVQLHTRLEFIASDPKARRHGTACCWLRR